MAEIHVRKDAGGAGSSVPTLAAATAIARPGDVIIVHAGVYRETLKPPAGTTWQAAEGEAVVIDGGWNGGKAAPDDVKSNQVLVNQKGVTLRGLEIRNVRGKGVAVAGGGDDFLMEDCEIHHTAAGGFGANGTGTLIHGVTLRGCYLHHLSLTGKWVETPVNGCCLFRYVIGLRVERLRIRFGYGEGFALGPWTQDAVVDGLVVEDTAHLAVYASNRARNVRFQNCVIIQRGLDEWRQGDGHVGSGFVVGDEVSGDKSARWPHADDIVIRNCIVVNAGGCVEVRNRKKLTNGKPDGYDTRPENLLVEGCTFVAGPDTRRGILIAENEFGNRVRGVFRRNLFILDQLAGGEALRSNAAGVAFDDNLFSGGVPPALPASNRPVSAAALVAPFATPEAALRLDNYRPRAGSVAVGYGALDALADEPPPPPPPPPGPDWLALYGLADATMGELLAAGAAVEAAVRSLQTLHNRIREYELAAQGGEE